jgi:hypothetical protein
LASERVKVLWFEGKGLSILYRRLHRAIFELPQGTEGCAFARIDGPALGQLLAGVAREGHRRKTRMERRWSA